MNFKLMGRISIGTPGAALDTCDVLDKWKQFRMADTLKVQTGISDIEQIRWKR